MTVLSFSLLFVFINLKSEKEDRNLEDQDEEDTKGENWDSHGPRAPGRSQRQASARRFPAARERRQDALKGADAWVTTRPLEPKSPGAQSEGISIFEKRDSEDKQNFSRGLVSPSWAASATPGPLSQGTSTPAH